MMPSLDRPIERPDPPRQRRAGTCHQHHKGEARVPMTAFQIARIRAASRLGAVGVSTNQWRRPCWRERRCRICRRQSCGPISANRPTMGRDARAAHAPEPVAGTRMACAPPDRARPCARANAVIREALRAKSAPALVRHLGVDVAGEAHGRVIHHKVGAPHGPHSRVAAGGYI